KTIAHGPALRHRLSPADRWERRPAYDRPGFDKVADAVVIPCIIRANISAPEKCDLFEYQLD
ncbi:hypothetical protein, partial [Rhodomicrobium vannielii]